VSCNRAGTVLHGYFDCELDILDASEFERHLEHCSDCVNALEALQFLRSSMNLTQLYEKAPAPFRKKVLASLGSGRSVAASFPSRTVWSWLAAAAAILVTVYLGVQLGTSQRAGDYGTELAAEIVDAHLRSLQPGHLVDVVSTDQHTVKPWFNGKLDVAPPVVDLTAQGFRLLGGRLDYIDGESVASVVYQRRKHIINLFVAQRLGASHASTRIEAIQGYNVRHWSEAGLDFWAVSDIAPDELDEFGQVMVAALHPAGSS